MSSTHTIAPSLHKRAHPHTHTHTPISLDILKATGINALFFYFPFPKGIGDTAILPASGQGQMLYVCVSALVHLRVRECLSVCVCESESVCLSVRVSVSVCVSAVINVCVVGE